MASVYLGTTPLGASALPGVARLMLGSVQVWPPFASLSLIDFSDRVPGLPPEEGTLTAGGVLIYAAPAAQGAGDGTSPDDAMTFADAYESASAGDVVVLRGDLGVYHDRSIVFDRAGVTIAARRVDVAAGLRPWFDGAPEYPDGAKVGQRTGTGEWVIDDAGLDQWRLASTPADLSRNGAGMFFAGGRSHGIRIARDKTDLEKNADQPQGLEEAIQNGYGEPGNENNLGPSSVLEAGTFYLRFTKACANNLRPLVAMGETAYPTNQDKNPNDFVLHIDGPEIFGRVDQPTRFYGLGIRNYAGYALECRADTEVHNCVGYGFNLRKNNPCAIQLHRSYFHGKHPDQLSWMDIKWAFKANPPERGQPRWAFSFANDGNLASSFLAADCVFDNMFDLFLHEDFAQGWEVRNCALLRIFDDASQCDDELNEHWHHNYFNGTGFGRDRQNDVWGTRTWAYYNVHNNIMLRAYAAHPDHIGGWQHESFHGPITDHNMIFANETRVHMSFGDTSRLTWKGSNQANGVARGNIVVAIQDAAGGAKAIMARDGGGGGVPDHDHAIYWQTDSSGEASLPFSGDPYATLADFRAAFGGDANSSYENPRFKGGDDPRTFTTFADFEPQASKATTTTGVDPATLDGGNMPGTFPAVLGIGAIKPDTGGKAWDDEVIGPRPFVEASPPEPPTSSLGFNAGGAGYTTGTSHAATHSYALEDGTGRLALAIAHYDGMQADDLSATFDGAPMTLLFGGFADSNPEGVTVFGYLIPDGLPAGSYDVVISTTDSGSLAAGAVVLDGFPGALGDLQTASGTVTGTATIAIDISGLTVGAGDLVLLAHTSNNPRGAGGYGAGQSALYFANAPGGQSYDGSLSYEIGETSSMSVSVGSTTSDLAAVVVVVPESA